MLKPRHKLAYRIGNTGLALIGIGLPRGLGTVLLFHPGDRRDLFAPSGGR